MCFAAFQSITLFIKSRIFRTMQELTEDLSDVTNLLSSGTVDFDDEELEQELRDMEQEPEGAMEELPASSNAQTEISARFGTHARPACIT